jgi:hypothetical protein
MEETPRKEESTASTIEIFLCYAHEDKAFLKKLEQHLAPLKRQGLITAWHDGDIHAGATWEQEIHVHLHSAQLVLLLVSPSFMDSDYCYSIEMTQALERQRRGESRVIPVIVRAVYWQGEPLGALQVLPPDGKPIASWRHQDEAFLKVIEGIRQVVEEIKTQMPLSTLSQQSPENSEKDFQKTNVIERIPLPEILETGHETPQESTGSTSSKGLFQMFIPHPSTTVEDASLTIDEHIFLSKSRNSRKRKLLVSIIIFLVLAASLLPFLPLSTCSFAFCRSSTQSTKEPSPQSDGKIQDQNLSVELVAVASPSFMLPDDPKHYSDGTPLPTSISAVLLPQNASTYDTIVINVRNLRYGGADILIDYVALKLLSIPELPRPLRVWTPGVSTTYIGYPYPVTYVGQQPGQLVYANPPKLVILTPAGLGRSGESDPLSLQVTSTGTAYLRFQVEIAYQITGPEQMLILPQVFQVVFSDASNWQEEHL